MFIQMVKFKNEKMNNIDTKHIYDCGLKYAQELAQREGAELNIDTTMIIAKDYSRYVKDFLERNK